MRRVLQETPGSIRALAREAGVSHVLLTKIRDGDRRLTPDTREALAAALERWSDSLDSLATELREGRHNGDD